MPVQITTKMEKMASTNRFTATIILCLMIIFMQISVVSAADWDNVKNFNPNKPIKGEIEIKNALGFGSTLATYQITSHSDYCLIDCYTEGIATFYSNDKLFRSIKFYDKGNKEKSIDYKIYLLEDKVINYNEDTYTNVCTSNSNSTYTSCDNVKNGTIEKTRTDKVFVEYDGRTLAEGNYTWRIEAKKGATENIDWIGESFGVGLEEWAWWNSNWLYKKEVKIQERTGNAWSNYSAYINVTYDSDMQIDFDDLRFLNSGETIELPYYIESKVNSNSAQVWIKTPLTASVNTSVYMYYGNPSASTTSDANNSFILYDDAKTDKSTSWSCGTGLSVGWDSSGNYTLTDGSVTGWGSCNYIGKQNVSNFSFTATIYRLSTGYIGITGRNTGTLGQSFYRMAEFDGNTGRLSKWVSGSETHLVTTAYTYASPTIFTLSAFGTNINGSLAPTGGSEVKYTAVDTALSTAGTFGLNIYENTASYKIKNLIGREYGYPEPSATFGAEIQNVGITLTDSYPANNSNLSTTTINFGCNVSSTGQNITLIVFNVSGTAKWNQNITGLNTPSYNATFTNTTLIDGTYNWNCIGYGSAGINDSSATWRLNIDRTAPNITITKPINQTYYHPAESINVTALDNIVGSQACWYSWNGAINETLTKSGNNYYNITNKTINAGVNYVVVYCNDTLGNIGSNSTSFYGDTSIPQISITSPIGVYYSNNVTLNYSAIDTNLQACKYSLNGAANVTLTSCANSTLILSAGKNTIFVYINDSFGSSNYSNTTAYYLQNPNINATCSAGYFAARTFKFYNETNLLAMNTSIQYTFNFTISDIVQTNFNGSLSNIDTFSICINNSIYNYTTNYGEIQYSASGYADRRFYLYNGTILTSNTITSNVYSLESALSTSFLTTITNNQLTPYVGYYLSSLRWYPSINSYNVVEMSKTDNKGQTLIKVKTEDVDYRLGLYDPNGVLVKLYDPVRLVCTTSPCTYNLFAATSGTEYDSYYGVQTSLTRNNNTGIVTFTWSDPSQKTASMNLTIVKVGGVTDYTICSTTGTGSTGVLSCNTSGYSGMIFASAFRTASPAKIIASESWDIRLSNFLDTSNGKTMSLFMGFILVSIIALVGIFAPILALFLSVIAMVPLIFLGAINYMIFIGFGILAFLVYHAIKRSG